MAWACCSTRLFPAFVPGSASTLAWTKPCAASSPPTCCPRETQSMRIVGLTGGIGMGKSTAAAAFRRAHIPVFDADAVVHKLQAPGARAIRPIAAAFPGVVHHGVLDRAALRHIVFNNGPALARLEVIIHPMVRQ